MGATRRRTRLRCCSARTGFEVLDPLGEKSKMGPDGAPFSFLAERVGFETTDKSLTIRCAAVIVSEPCHHGRVIRCYRTPSSEAVMGTWFVARLLNSRIYLKLIQFPESLRPKKCDDKGCKALFANTSDVEYRTLNPIAVERHFSLSREANVIGDCECPADGH